MTRWPSYLYLAWSVGEAIFRRRVGGEGLWRWRDRLMIVSRLLHTFEFGTISTAYISILLEAARQGNTIISASLALVLQGLVPMAFMGFFQPVRFRLHLPLQLLTSAFLFATVNMQICKLTDAGGVPGMGWLMAGLESLANKAVGAMFGCSPSWNVEFPCLQQALFLQMYLGFGAISYIVWLSEHQSRTAFVQLLPATERPRHWYSEPVQWSTVMMHIVIFLVAFGVIWAAFLNLAPGIISCGMCGTTHYTGPPPEICANLDPSFGQTVGTKLCQVIFP
eukprot:evm.model.scf_12EXC.13 EVM.evm.TU.scf_12EXC.13   scf_12EXC:117973-120071(-)